MQHQDNIQKQLHSTEKSLPSLIWRRALRTVYTPILAVVAKNIKVKLAAF